MEFFGVDLVELIRTVGYAGVWGIVFAETGLFLGFFLPGDSLLFVAGFLSGGGYFSLPIMLIGVSVSASFFTKKTRLSSKRRIYVKLSVTTSITDLRPSF